MLIQPLLWPKFEDETFAVIEENVNFERTEAYYMRNLHI